MAASEESEINADDPRMGRGICADSLSMFLFTIIWVFELPILIFMCHGERDNQIHAFVCSCQNCPIKKYLMRQPFSSSAMRITVLTLIIQTV